MTSGNDPPSRVDTAALLASVDIVEVIGLHITLKNSGADSLEAEPRAPVPLIDETVRVVQRTFRNRSPGVGSFSLFPLSLIHI